MRSIAFLDPARGHRPNRWRFFEEGARILGWGVSLDACSTQPGDVVVSWNRSGSKNTILERMEDRGVLIAVAENGYCGCDENGRRLTAFGWRDHGTSGNAYCGPGDRWLEQGIEVKPWRHEGSDIVVLQQRGIGRPPVASPPQWAERTAAELKKHTKRKVRIRAHPGKGAPAKPLEDDLANAWCVVTWASSAAIRAMIMGVPCFYAYSKWIAREGGKLYSPSEIERPLRPDRQRMLRAVSWAQWSDAEIAAGLPLKQPMTKVYR